MLWVPDTPSTLRPAAWVRIKLLTRIIIKVCGRTIDGGATVTPDSDCDMPCQGNSTEACGGPNRLTMFYNPDGPVVNPGPGNWGYMGCYT